MRTNKKKKAAEHEYELKKRLVGVLEVSDWYVISSERRILRHFITSFAFESIFFLSFIEGVNVEIVR